MNISWRRRTSRFLSRPMCWWWSLPMLPSLRWSQGHNEVLIVILEWNFWSFWNFDNSPPPPTRKHVSHRNVSFLLIFFSIWPKFFQIQSKFVKLSNISVKKVPKFQWPPLTRENSQFRECKPWGESLKNFLVLWWFNCISKIALLSRAILYFCTKYLEVPKLLM